MSLQQLAMSIREDAERIRDRNRLVRDVQEYADLEADFKELTAHLREVTKSVGVLRAAGVELEIERPPSAATESLRAMTPEGATIIDAPAATAKPAVKDLKRWANEAARQVRDAHQSWVESLLGDLDGADRFARQLGRLGVRDGVRIQGLVAKGRVRRHTVPSSSAELDEVKELAGELREATQAVAPSEDTRRFLRAVLEGGAPLDLLTDDVRAWAVERGFWQSLRVRLGGDADG
jgi:hypothetical protein